MSNFIGKLFRVEREDSDRFRKAIFDGIEFRGRKVWILIFAVITACVGLELDNKSVLIGAMLISPIMGPINGTGVGFATADRSLLVGSLKNLGTAIIIVLFVSSGYFFISPIQGPTNEILSRTSVSFYHALIGIAGGITGILAKSRPEDNNVVPGVAIATALLPPLCSIGFGLATANAGVAFDSLKMFGLYFLCMSLSGMITTWAVLRRSSRR